MATAVLVMIMLSNPPYLRKEAWQENDACGVNCLHCYLALTGFNLDYAAVRKAAGPIPEGGFSAHDLINLSEQFGQRLVIARASGRKGLSGLTTPFIAHLSNGYCDHWVVVTRVNADSIEIINGSDGERAEAPLGRFISGWTGFVLVGVTGELAHRWVFWALAMPLAVILAMKWSATRRRALAAILGALLIAEPTSAQSVTRDAAAAAAVQWAKGVKELPGIEIEYRLECTRVAIDADGMWLFPWLEYRTLCDFRGSKVLNLVRQPMNSFLSQDPENEGRVLSRGFGFDGKLVAQYSGQEARAGRVAVHEVNGALRRQLVKELYFFEHLGLLLFPELEGEDQMKRSHRKGTFWLPGALIENLSEYHVDPKKHVLGGQECWLLERPGVDKLWIQVAPYAMIRQRQSYWLPGGEPRDLITYSNEKQVAPGLWIPQTISVNHFCEPWDGKDRAGRTKYLHRLTASKLAARQIDDVEFQNEIKPGTEVYDYVTNKKGNVYVTSPDANPFDEIAAGARAGRQVRVWVIAGSVAAAALVGFLLWRRARKLQRTA